MSATINQSCTSGDVTITVDQCIVDYYFAFLSFNVKGYQLAEGAEPHFEKFKCSVEGSEIDWNNSESVKARYMQEDGELPTEDIFYI